MNQCAENGLLKVHLGAFDQSVPGWMNTDITLHLFIARIPFLPLLLYLVRLMPRERYLQHKNQVFNRLKHVNLTRPLPFKDGSVIAFFSSHVMEHLFFDEVEKLITEMYRCLVPGGVCRVVVPDLERIMERYDGTDPRLFFTELSEAKTRSSVKITHHSAFTGPLLVEMFKKAGFCEATLLKYRVGRCPDIEMLDNRPDESLFFEAVR